MARGSYRGGSRLDAPPARPDPTLVAGAQCGSSGLSRGSGRLRGGGAHRRFPFNHSAWHTMCVHSSVVPFQHDQHFRDATSRHQVGSLLHKDGINIKDILLDGGRSDNMDSSWLQFADPVRSARDLTVEAAQAASTSRIAKSSSAKSMPFLKLKALLDSRSDRDILEGLRKVISVWFWRCANL